MLDFRIAFVINRKSRLMPLRSLRVDYRSKGDLTFGFGFFSGMEVLR